MKAVKKLKAKIGTYKNKDGEEKNRYIEVGTLFVEDHQVEAAKEMNFSIRQEAQPVGPEFNGWISVFDIEYKPRDAAPQISEPIAPPVAGEEDIPF